VADVPGQMSISQMLASNAINSVPNGGQVSLIRCLGIGEPQGLKILSPEHGPAKLANAQIIPGAGQVKLCPQGPAIFPKLLGELKSLGFKLTDNAHVANQAEGINASPTPSYRSAQEIGI
jgi:hypothetical protein